MTASLEDLLADYIARRESGERVTPEEYAQRFPEQGAELLECLRELGQTEELFPDADASLPGRIGAYRVLGAIGSGGMGRVLEVEHVDRPGEVLALKLLHLTSQMNPQALERFEREARILRQMQHPGIVPMRDVGQADGQPFFVMDRVEGEALSATITQAREERGERRESASNFIRLGAGAARGDGARRAAEVVLALARAIAELHRQGCLHRDLKPSNVILGSSGAPVVIDFGLAGSEGATTLTHTGDLIGTPHYMSPEQAAGRIVDERADVWALGAILYELLCLEPPHVGADPVAVLHAIQRRPVTPLRRRDRSIPVPLARIVERALAYRRERRYPDAGALAADLEAFLAGRPVTARRSLGDRCAEVWRFRRPAVFSALAVLVVFTFAVWSWSRTRVANAEDLRRAIDRAAMAWIVEDADGMRTSARRVLELDPGNATGEFLASLAEGSVLVDSEDPAVEALIRGIRSVYDGRLGEARDYYRDAAELDPSSPLPLIMLGMAGDEEGHLEQRARDLRVAYDANPRSAAVARALGSVLQHLERHAESATVLTRAVENDPDVAESYSDLAFAQYHSETPEAGLETVELASERLGKSGDAALIKYSILLSMNGHSGMARESLFLILPRNEKNPELLCQLARTYDFEERLLEALPWYEKALEQDPEHLESLKALFHMHAGANRDTCEQCARVFRDNPDLLDADRVEEYGVRMLKIIRGDNLGLMIWIVNTSGRMGRIEAIERTLEELLDEDLPEEQLGNLEQALEQAGSQ